MIRATLILAATTIVTYDWTEIRDQAIELFDHDQPGARLEEAILTHFQDHPARVVDLIQAIGRRVQAGGVRSGWAILRTELDRKPTGALVANDQTERHKAVHLSEQWLRNTGGYLDREDEIIDELFGDRGRLRHWPDLQPRILELWRELRPRFVQADLEAVERGRRYQAQRERIRQAASATSSEVDPDEHAANVHAEVARVQGILTPEGDINWEAA